MVYDLGPNQMFCLTLRARGLYSQHSGSCPGNSIMVEKVGSQTGQHCSSIQKSSLQLDAIGTCVILCVQHYGPFFNLHNITRSAL